MMVSYQLFVFGGLKPPGPASKNTATGGDVPCMFPMEEGCSLLSGKKPWFEVMDYSCIFVRLRRREEFPPS